ncbi:unnamed protein product [Parnassius mnemosyne]|uniref:Uncharacterized protein n=1 Tax=Parnassius mnemosyne TaxID=213953 RepID=A0AAV1KYS7_9NEOP
MAKQDDSLFLLEVLIDKIAFIKSPCFTDKDFRTCVNIECPSVEPFEICDDDPGSNATKSGGPFIKTFNSGKSCLFSLKEADIGKAMSKFPIKVTVYKSLPCGCLPTKIVMGEATIDMTKEFIQARNKFIEDPSGVSYQALKDAFRIVGPDGGETGEIIMFLRISCFGKLIVTKFQGTGVATKLETDRTVAPIDRSCRPQRDYQTVQDPCVCGATRHLGDVSVAAQPSCTTSKTAGFGICPSARDPFNSMPCQESDDPCYCSGPKPPVKQNMICRNMDQYCLHVPKGTFLSLPRNQDKVEVNKNNIASDEIEPLILDLYKTDQRFKAESETTSNYESLQCLTDSSNMDFSNELRKPNSITADIFSASSVCTVSTIRSKRRSVSFSRTIDYFWSLQNKTLKSSTNYLDRLNSEDESRVFGNNETTVYMTLFDDRCHLQCSGTQATGSVNKCIQINRSKIFSPSYGGSTNKYSPMKKLLCRDSIFGIPNNIRNPEIYLFGRKKNKPESKKGMGSEDSVTNIFKKEPSPTISVKKDLSKSSEPSTVSTQAKSLSSTASMQTKRSKKPSSGVGTAKTVSITTKTQQPCPAIGTVNEDMMVTVSHIKIGPKQTCPIYGHSPCQGPKCVAAATQEEQAPVKVSTVNNPRRGVFELVIRKMTGAPLAKNELMLEWTPPQCRIQPSSSGFPCSMSYKRPKSCNQSKYKLIACSPSPCRAKYNRKIYIKSCSPIPRVICPPAPCKRCRKISCCGKSCLPSRSCSPLLQCIRRSPTPCISPCPPPPCYKNPCRSPCFSSPCLRPCPVGRRRPRRSRSQPRIRAHPKRISPCCNRAKLCPVVRCQSPFRPSIGCCPLHYCHSIKTALNCPRKPLNCCKSSCTTNCG